MNQELEESVRTAFEAVDSTDLKAIVDMMADDIEQVDELTQRWSRCKVNVVAAMTPLFNIVNAIKSVLADFRVAVSNDIRLSRACSTRAMFWEAS